MAGLRSRWPALLALLIGACHEQIPCRDGTVFVDLAGIVDADHVHVEVMVGAAVLTGDAPYTGQPGIEIDFPNGYPVGETIVVTVVAGRDGAEVSGGSTTATLSATCEHLEVMLSEGVDSGLAAEWPLDDGSGTVARDVSGNGNDATLIDTTWTTGVHGGALSFDGTSSMLAPSLNAASFPTSGALSLWLFADFTGTDQRDIFDTFDSTRDHLFIRQFLTGSSHVQVALQQSSNSYAYHLELNLNSGTWTHLVVTWDQSANAVATYVDGALIESSMWAGTFVPSAEHVELGGTYVGSIDDVRLYNRPLSVAEVMSLP